MLGPGIEEFARALIHEVRDKAISNCDLLLETDNSQRAKNLRELVRAGDSRALATRLISECVDETLACFLRAVDSGAMRVSFTASDDKLVDLEKAGLGELAGWYLGSCDGWREKYSKERFVDYFVE